jgi:hypothetical protein
MVSLKFGVEINCTVKVYYSSMNARVIVLKSIKIYTKIAPTYFGAVTPSSGSSLSVLGKVILC